MRILLITRCGCQQWKEISEKYPPPLYHIPLLRSISIEDYTSDFEATVMDRRTFEYKDSSRYGNFHVYIERP